LIKQRDIAYPDAFAELTSPACTHDPYPFKRWLREHDPVHRAASGLFLLSRHADICRKTLPVGFVGIATQPFIISRSLSELSR
jgi:hypothetical protein